MKIAIASQNWLTVTNHPGKTGRFRVFEAAPESEPKELERIDLPTELMIHNWRGGAPHPLFEMDVIIAGSAGAGFINRLVAQGVKVVTTSERNPLVAIAGLFAGPLPPAVPHAH